MASPLHTTARRRHADRSLSPEHIDRVERADDEGRTTRPRLSVVPARRRAASLVVFVMTMVSVAMIVAVLLHTRIAERQLEIDEFNRGVRSTQEEYDELRAMRAELRSPANLSDTAEALGMRPAVESDFLDVDPFVLARVIATTGQLPNSGELTVGATGSLDPLDQFRLVKEVASEAP